MILGTEPILPPTSRREFHVERAYWLTVRVETGATFGTVMAYDGTGMTAGPDQHIAVYPQELASEDYNSKDDQGDLWKLLRRMEVGGEAPPEYYHAVGALWSYFKSSMNAYISQDGYLRYIDKGECKFPNGEVETYDAGAAVFGHHIRSALTPGVDGRVPKTGPDWNTAAHVAEMFHTLMMHPNGRQIQLEFGKEHLIHRTNFGPARPLGYNNREVSSIRVGQDGWTEALDLALSVYQSNSVNAPAIASRALVQATRGRLGDWDHLAKALIQALGNSSFGRWDDDLPNGRYQRTRSAAMASGLWSNSLFTGPSAIMPKDLLG